MANSVQQPLRSQVISSFERDMVRLNWSRKRVIIIDTNMLSSVLKANDTKLQHRPKESATYVI